MLNCRILVEPIIAEKTGKYWKLPGTNLPRNDMPGNIGEPTTEI